MRMQELPNTRAGAEEPVHHGGNLDEMRARYPHAPAPWIDLSTGINPVAYPFAAPAAEAWTRLPTRADLAALLRAAARRYGVDDADGIVAAPGTQALIQCLPRLVAPTRVAVLGPTYDEHEVCWKRQGHQVRVVRDPGETGDAQVIVIVNPNNPTGRLVGPGEIRALATGAAARGGLVVVDEAFIDVLPPGASVCATLPQSTVVLRSFGKTYGLAGVRLGFAVAGRAFARRIEAELGPWAVSGAALAIGTQALGDEPWLDDAVERLTGDAVRLDRLLAAAGCELAGGTPLFRLVRHRDAHGLAGTLREHGIHVRAFEREPTWLRFGLPADATAWARLEGALLTAR